jgi:hypothetical protein
MAKATIHLNSKQSAFTDSEARFPAFVGGWGSGKTMVGILKGLQLSQAFPKNLGMIVRKKFTDLRDSTLKDFERYTGLAVKKDAKEVTLSNGSTIMFRHGDELSKLQNVNLGWFMIEQAEEFDSAEQFDLLRGRMRRDEAKVHKGMVIANTAGHNWVWDRWKNKKLNNYSLVESNIEDCRNHLPQATLDDWEQLKDESPKKYNRYILNSWEDYDLEGAFYASLMSDALKQDRSGLECLYEPDQPVYTFWDLGVSDTTVIWCVQFIRGEVWLIDYYENHSEGIGHYAKWLRDKTYIYKEHYLPHDGNQRIQGEQVQTRKQILQNLMNEPVMIVNRHFIMERIECVRLLLHKCKFSDKCKMGVDGLNHYKRKRNDARSTDARSVFDDKPLHDWASNPADAFGYMAMAYRSQLMIDGQMVGYTTAATVEDEVSRMTHDYTEYDPMENRVRRRA